MHLIIQNLAIGVACFSARQLDGAVVRSVVGKVLWDTSARPDQGIVIPFRPAKASGDVRKRREAAEQLRRIPIRRDERSQPALHRRQRNRMRSPLTPSTRGERDYAREFQGEISCQLKK